jgi:cell division protein FtsQ
MKRPQGPSGAAPVPSRRDNPVAPQATTTSRLKPTRAQRKATAQAKKTSATRVGKSLPSATSSRSDSSGSRVQGIRRPVSEATPKKTTADSVEPQPSRRPARRVTPAQREADDAKRKLKEAIKARKAFERDEVRRFTAHLRRRKVVWATIAGSLAAIMIFVGIGVFTPVLALQTITVEGATRVPADQIQAALQPQINKPLPMVDMGEVRKAVEAQPLVKSYSTVAVPPHTLVIKIVERGPIGYLATGKTLTMVDPAGVVIEQNAERIPGIPVLTVEGGSAQSKGFLAAVDVINSLPAALAGQLDEVIANTTDDVTLVLVGGARVFWGGPENAAMKNRVLSQLLAVNPVGTVTEYDVSSPKTAVVR